MRERVLDSVVEDALKMFRQKHPHGEPLEVFEHCAAPFRGEEGGDRMEEIIKDALQRILQREKEQKEGKGNNQHDTEREKHLKDETEEKHIQAIVAAVRRGELHSHIPIRGNTNNRELKGNKMAAKDEMGKRYWEHNDGWWNWPGEVRWEGM